MHMSKLSLSVALAAFCFSMGSASGAQRKEADKDVVYDEEKVPQYELPPLLVT